MKKLDLIKTLLLSCDDWVTIDYLLKVRIKSLVIIKSNKLILRLIKKIQQHHGIELVVLMEHLQK